MERFLRYAARTVETVPISQAVGGEGYCCKIRGQPRHSIKEFSTPIPADLESRLVYQVNNPPATIADRTAWPQDLVEDGQGDVVGYLQQHFSRGFVPFTAIASTKTRPRWANGRVLLRCAYEAAYLIAELHAQNYLYPDIHEEQFLVAKNRPVVLIDMAACQFQANGTLYACSHCLDEYQPPGLHDGGDWLQAASRRDVGTDSWSLAFLLFQMTMGCLPFQGIHVGQGENLSPSERAEQGLFPFDRGCRDYKPPPQGPPYRTVDPEIQNLFYRCFVEGHRHEHRALRPTPGEWADALRHCPVLRDGLGRCTITTPSPLKTLLTASSPGQSDVTSFVRTHAKPLRALALAAAVMLICLFSYRVGCQVESPHHEHASPSHQPAVPQPSVPPHANKTCAETADIEKVLDLLRHRNRPQQKETQR